MRSDQTQETYLFRLQRLLEPQNTVTIKFEFPEKNNNLNLNVKQALQNALFVLFKSIVFDPFRVAAEWYHVLVIQQLVQHSN